MRTRNFHICISPEGGSLSNSRIRMEILSRTQSCLKALLGAVVSHQVRRAPKIFAKWIHRLTHASNEQIKIVYEQAEVLDEKLAVAIDEVFDASDICRS